MLPNENFSDEYLWLTMVIYCFIHSLNNIYCMSVTVLGHETMAKKNSYRNGKWEDSYWKAENGTITDSFGD